MFQPDLVAEVFRIFSYESLSMKNSLHYWDISKKIWRKKYVIKSIEKSCMQWFNNLYWKWHCICNLVFISNTTHLREMVIFIYIIYSNSLIYWTFFCDYVSAFCCSHTVVAEACDFQVLKQMAALCLLLWHG